MEGPDASLSEIRRDIRGLCSGSRRERSGCRGFSVGRRELDLLPHHAGLVNVSRAALIDNTALARKLRNGTLAGAVLDVLPEEPLPASSPLWSTPNLIISPHCGIDSGASFLDRLLPFFFENVDRYLHGRGLRNIVDARLGY